MFCPRLNHFVRLNGNGTIGKCGHMVQGMCFSSHEEQEQSDWLAKLKQVMDSDQWPDECVRCEQSEKIKGESVRTKSIIRHKVLHSIRKDYLIVGGVLDNICNSACQTCHAGLSTKIGSLESKNYPRVDNREIFNTLPKERILELDISGGEPTASKNYRDVLENLPDNIKIVRMNTNGSRTIKEVEKLLERGITVIVTMSLDGLGKTHDYIRWPIQWPRYESTLNTYLQMRDKHSNFKLDAWTTVSCLNVATLPDIQQFTKDKGIPHDWAFLQTPDVLNVKYKNRFTEIGKFISPEVVAVDKDNTEQLDTFIASQDKLRSIKIGDYFNLE